MRKITILLLASAFVLFAGAAFAAGIQSSFHDVPDYKGPEAGVAGACAYCHVPHGGVGAKLYSSVANTSGATISWDDQLSMVCFNCHVDPTGFPFATNVNMFDQIGHQRNVDILAGWGDDSAANIMGGNIYAVENTGGVNYITCASCHNIHDPDVRPFLRNNAGDGDLAEGDLATLCNDCHSLRVPTVNRENHPTSTTFTNGSGRARILAFASTATALDVAVSDPTALTAPPAVSPLHWNLGGKLVYNATTGLPIVPQEFNCASCHGVHSNETATFDSDADGDTSSITVAVDFPVGTSGASNSSVKVVLDRYPEDGGASANSPMCMGCHDTSAGTSGSEGPGADNTYSHPWGGVANSMPIGVPGGATYGLGLLTQTLGCLDCHNMHWSNLDQSDGIEYIMTRRDCGDCHGSTGARADHHPSGMVVVAGVDVEFANLAAAPISDGADYTSADVMADNLTLATTGTNYNFPGGIMGCGTCHRAGQVHNNALAFIPGIVGDIDEAEMCIDCHGSNPSDNTATEPQAGNSNGSHYLGVVANMSNFWQSSNTEPGILPTATEDLRNLSPDGANGSITCLSCHSLKIDGYSRNITVQSSQNTASATSPYTVGMLLTNSGNDRDSAAIADYLCTACHGEGVEVAGGGSGTATHPVEPSFSVNYGAASATVIAGVAGTEHVTLTTTDAVNCESCHRPHDADTDGGTYILEKADLNGGFLNEAALCASCHTDKY